MIASAHRERSRDSSNGADGVPPRHLLDRGARGRSQRKGLVDGVVDAVVVAEGVLAGLLVAGASAPGVEADAVAGRQGHALELEAGPPQVGERLFGDGAAARLGGEVEDLLDAPLADRLNRGKQHRDGLADPGRRLGVETALGGDGVGDAGGQLLLARAEVREGEAQPFDRAVPVPAVLAVGALAAEVAGDDLLEETGELPDREGAAVFADFAGAELQVGQLNVDLGNPVPDPEDVAVDPGLGPVQGVVAASGVEAAVGRLDLFDQEPVPVEEHPVGAAADLEGDGIGLVAEGDGDLALVAVGAQPLHVLVAARSLDGALRGDERRPEVSGAEGEADEVADGNLNENGLHEVAGDGPPEYN